MKIYHDCGFKKIRIPKDMTTVITKDRCKICGEFWKVTHRHQSWEMQRRNIPNFKNWNWTRKRRRELQASRTSS